MSRVTRLTDEEIKEMVWALEEAIRAPGILSPDVAQQLCRMAATHIKLLRPDLNFSATDSEALSRSPEGKTLSTRDIIPRDPVTGEIDYGNED